MKVIVPILRVADPARVLKVAADGILCDSQAPEVMNPYDEVALSQAVGFKLNGQVDEVIAIGVGTGDYPETLRSALAMQADRAIWVETAQTPSPHQQVSALAALICSEQPALILCGKQSAGDDAAYLPQMLAGRLNYPQAISAVTLAFKDNALVARCDHRQGMADITLPLPAVIGVDLLLCPPRFPTLAQILKAKKQTIETVAMDALEIGQTPTTQVVRRQLAPSRGPCQWLDSTEEMAALIRRHAQ